MESFIDAITLDLDIFLRLLLAVIIGAIIGIDREIKRRPGGIKTHSLVCLGSALVMVTSEFIATKYGTDVSRIPAQVISGIGFLGAGTILITGRNQIKGLTSAAGLWFSACQGLAIGIGFYDIAIAALVLSIIITNLFSYLDKFIQKRSRYSTIHVEYTQSIALSKIIKIIKAEEVKIINFDSYRGNNYHGEPAYVVIFQLKLKSTHELQSLKLLLREVEGIMIVEEI